MVHTIAPVVYGEEGSNSQLRWLPAAILYVFGTGVTAVIMGSFLGFMGKAISLNEKWPVGGLVLVGLLSTLYALHELHLVRLPHPQRRQQVPAEWRYRFHPYLTATFFGMILGTGYLTYISVATLYIISLATVVYGSPILGAILFGLYGLGRSGLLVPLAWYARTQRKAYAISTRLMTMKPLVHLLNGWSLAFTGTYILTSLLSIVLKN